MLFKSLVNHFKTTSCSFKMLKIFILVVPAVIFSGIFAGGPSALPPIKTPCDFIQPLYMQNGTYMKTVCIIYDPKGLNETIAQCESLNMEIYDVDSWGDYDALYQISTDFIPPFSAEWWVKPINSTTCLMASLTTFWYV